MSKPRFKASFKGDDDNALRVELTSYERGTRMEVKHFQGALPVSNCFAGNAEGLDQLIEGFVRARDILHGVGK